MTKRSSKPWTTLMWVMAPALVAVLTLAPGAFATTTVSNVTGDFLELSGSDSADQVTATVVPNPLFDPTNENTDSRALRVEDPAGAFAGTGASCQQVDPTTARCQLSQTANFRLNGGDDTFRFTHGPEFSCAEILDIEGGGGNDKILGSQCGETLLGNAGNDLLDGRAGRDIVSGDRGGRTSPTSFGQDRVYGGPGSDSLDDSESSPAADTISGGSCPAGTVGFCPSPALAEDPGDRDQLDFTSRTAGVILDLAFQGTPNAGDPPQGVPGENNTVVGVEDAATGSGADTVTGNGAVNDITTAEGNDNVDVRGDGANVDSVDCGAGAADVLMKDAPDTALNCELDAPPAGGGTLPPGGTTLPPGGTTPAIDSTMPSLTSVSLSRTRFRAAGSGPSISTAVGTTVSYRLSEAAAVKFRIERALPGRRVGGRCVKPTRSNRSKRKCTRYKTLRGSFTHQGKAGQNSFKFSGRLRGRKLTPGRYRLREIATDAANNRSALKRNAFRIVRR